MWGQGRPAMDHDRYGLDGLPISCRPANSDPVTGQLLPRFDASDRDANSGNPHVLALVLISMVAFLVFFAIEAKIF